MADFAEILKTFSSLVVDYSSMFELGNPDLLDSLIEYVVQQEKTVYISRSFKVFHESVQCANNPNEKGILLSIKNGMKRLTDAKLLRASKSASAVDFFLEHIGKEDECLFIGRNSTSFSRLRNINAQGKCAVFVVNRGRIRFYPSLTECLASEPPYSVNPISGNSDFIASDINFGVGDVLYTDDDEEITLTSLISTGAEGLVFCTQQDNWVAKVYHRGGITPLRWYKLMKMRNLELETDNLCWPCRLLFSRSHVPVGYLMKRAAGTTISRAFDGPDAMEKYFPSWTRLHVVVAAITFLRIMDYLHLHGVIVGDIQLKNAMIEDEDDLYLIDMDSVQIQDLPCPVGTEEFTRPELWNKSFVTFLRRPQDEDYSIAILVFSMLFCGQHPYAQRNGLEMLRDEMEVRSFPYSVDDSQNERVPLGGYDKIWDALTEELKDMFVRAFAKGELFDSSEWTVALENYRDKLMNHAFEDEEMYRVFPYQVKEAPKPVRKTGKISIREAIMNSNLNSQEAMDSYNSQVPSANVEEKKKPEPQNPSFKGSSHSADSHPVKTEAPSEPQTGAFAKKEEPAEPKETMEIFKKPAVKTIEKPKEEPSAPVEEKPKKKGFFSRFRKK